MNFKPNMLFLNRSFDKKRLKALLLWFRLNLSENAALKAVEILQGLGFRSATQGAISLGLDDLKTPTSKGGRVFQAQVEVALAHHEHHRGNRTPVELFQHLVDTWHRTSQDLTTEVVQLFHSTERVNPVYMMAFSGARGNISQVRQLVGMRGLMADPRGQIVGFPILSNFREGLTITEYFVSCYGARKGVVDTAIRTADAGYLTRRLADVSHHVVVRTTNCGTHESILLRDIKEGQKTILSLANRLIGRVLAEHAFLPATETLRYSYVSHDLRTPDRACAAEGYAKQGHHNNYPVIKNQAEDPKVIAEEYEKSEARGTMQNFALQQNFREDKTKIIIHRNSEITSPLASKLGAHYLEVPVRSPLSCSLPWGVCQLCYGWGLSEGRRVTLGEAVGIIAAQSIGEPGTQLTLRTFHTGGVFSGELLNEIRAPYNGNVIFPTPLQGLLLRTPHGQIAFLTKVSGKMKISETEMDFESKRENLDTSLLNVRAKQRRGKPLKDSKDDRNRKAKALLNPQFLSQNLQNLRGKEQIEKINDCSSLKNEIGLFKQDSEFLIQPSTVIFVKQKEHVVNNQLLAEFSSSTLQSVNDQIEITQQVLSDIAGQIWFKELEYGNRKGPGSGSLGTYFSSQKLGGIWVLAGKPMIDTRPSFASPKSSWDKSPICKSHGKHIYPSHTSAAGEAKKGLAQQSFTTCTTGVSTKYKAKLLLSFVPHFAKESENSVANPLGQELGYHKALKCFRPLITIVKGKQKLQIKNNISSNIIKEINASLKSNSWNSTKISFPLRVNNNLVMKRNGEYVQSKEEELRITKLLCKESRYVNEVIKSNGLITSPSINIFTNTNLLLHGNKISPAAWGSKLGYTNCDRFVVFNNFVLNHLSKSPKINGSLLKRKNLFKYHIYGIQNRLKGSINTRYSKTCSGALQIKEPTHTPNGVSYSMPLGKASIINLQNNYGYSLQSSDVLKHDYVLGYSQTASSKKHSYASPSIYFSCEVTFQLNSKPLLFKYHKNNKFILYAKPQRNLGNQAIAISNERHYTQTANDSCFAQLPRNSSNVLRSQTNPLGKKRSFAEVNKPVKALGVITLSQYVQSKATDFSIQLRMPFNAALVRKAKKGLYRKRYYLLEEEMKSSASGTKVKADTRITHDKSFEKIKNKIKKSTLVFQELRSKFTSMHDKTCGSSKKLDMLPLLSESDLVTFVTNYGNVANPLACVAEKSNFVLKNSLENAISLPSIPVLPPLTPYFNKTSFSFSTSLSSSNIFNNCTTPSSKGLLPHVLLQGQKLAKQKRAINIARPLTKMWGLLYKSYKQLYVPSGGRVGSKICKKSYNICNNWQANFPRYLLTQKSKSSAALQIKEPTHTPNGVSYSMPLEKESINNKSINYANKSYLSTILINNKISLANPILSCYKSSICTASPSLLGTYTKQRKACCTNPLPLRGIRGKVTAEGDCFVSQGNKSSYFVTEKRRLQSMWIQKKRAYLIYLNQVCSIPFTQQFTKNTKVYTAEAFINFISRTNLQLSTFNNYVIPSAVARVIPFKNFTSEYLTSKMYKPFSKIIPLWRKGNNNIITKNDELRVRGTRNKEVINNEATLLNGHSPVPTAVNIYSATNSVGVKAYTPIGVKGLLYKSKICNSWQSKKSKWDPPASARVIPAKVFPGQLVTYGDNITSNIVTTESGQVLYIDSQKTTVRKAQTVLIYSQAIIAVLSGDWIKKGTPLMSLSYQKLVTGDIVQGLPKIEQFFEAPVLRDGTFWSDSLQAKLNQFFQEEREKLPLAEAVRKGFSEIQRVLVEGVLRVYISQGVLIADKHLEVIVRQMTCKGRILYSGDTGFLRNELVSLDKIENVNQVTYGQKALYHPQVRGITDASLESESFLSAASFQETTRVLSRDAIIGKTDLMRGLKERVIVGELIQAGTGLANNSVYNLLAHSVA